MTPTQSAGITSGTSSVKYRGVPFEFGDRIIIIPALVLDDAQEFADQTAPSADEIKSITAGVTSALKPELVSPEKRERTKARFVTMRNAILKAIRRNYPDFSEDDAREFVTMENVIKAFDAAMGYSNNRFRVKDAGELPPDWAQPESNK